MKVVVDSNIVISGLINAAGNECTILKNRNKGLSFISSKLIIEETSKKFTQISSLTKNPAGDIKTQFNNIVSSFELIDEKEIGENAIQKAAVLIQGLDNNDYLFLAITIYCNALLWTGDLKLYRGLRRKGFNNIVTTKELKEIIKGIKQ